MPLPVRRGALAVHGPPGRAVGDEPVAARCTGADGRLAG